MKNPKVKADFGNGDTHTINFEVVEPTEETAQKIQEFTALQLGILDDEQGVGMRVVFTVLPSDVSFSNVQIKEIASPAINKSGYFLQHPGAPHDPEDWVTLSELNNMIDFAAFKTMPKINVNGVMTWIPGSFEWDIPVRWRVAGKTTEGDLPNRHQKHEITDNNGASTETKNGESCSRTPTP